MKLPEISAADIKDWFARRAEPLNLDDEIIEEIAARGNRRAQRLEDEREASRLRHAVKPNSELPNIDSSQGNSVGRETQVEGEVIDSLKSYVCDGGSAGSSPAPGNIKQELIKADRRIAASLVDIPGASCNDHSPVFPVRQPAPLKESPD